MTTASPRGRWPAWLLFATWTLLIFASVPCVRPVQRWIADRFGSALFGYAVVVAIAAALAGAVLLTRRARRRLGVGSLLWLTAIAAVFVAWTLHLWARPEEAVHFVEYGVLGGLAFHALRQHRDDPGVHLAAALLVTLVGTCDEVLQWIAPERYWDLRDIVINAGAGALVQLALWRVLPGTERRVARRSLRLALRLAAAELGLLALCLANTPARVEGYVARFPSLAFLRTNPDAMAEYGHLHHDPTIGRFRSRFSLAELERLDAARAAEVGALLDQYPAPRYGEFLARYTPVTDPFAHEVRVHLFSRDHNLDEALRLAADPAAAAPLATVAWRENQLLETHFAHTLANSRCAWNAARRDEVAALVLPDLRFESKVGSHLITVLSERKLRALLLVAALALLVLDWKLGRKGGGP